MLVALAVAGAVVYLLIRPKPPTPATRAGKYIGMCPLQAGRPLVILDRTRHKTQHYYFYSIIDPDTGERTKRSQLYSGRFAPRPWCLGFEADLMWIRVNNKLRAYDLQTGKQVVSHEDIVAKLSATLDRLDFDRKSNSVIARTRDGRAHQLVTTPQLSFRPFADPQRIRIASGVNLPEGAKRAWGSDRIHGEKLWTRGSNPRQPIMLGHHQLGKHDWLRPAFALNAKTRHPLWPSPDSLIVVEQTELKSGRYRITRVGLDGVELWQHTPHSRCVGSSKSWFSTPSARTLLYIDVTPALIGVDPATGKQRFRVEL